MSEEQVAAYRVELLAFLRRRRDRWAEAFITTRDPAYKRQSGAVADEYGQLIHRVERGQFKEDVKSG